MEMKYCEECNNKKPIEEFIYSDYDITCNAHEEVEGDICHECHHEHEAKIDLELASSKESA